MSACIQQDPLLICCPKKSHRAILLGPPQKTERSNHSQSLLNESNACVSNKTAAYLPSWALFREARFAALDASLALLCFAQCSHLCCLVLLEQQIRPQGSAFSSGVGRAGWRRAMLKQGAMACRIRMRRRQIQRLNPFATSCAQSQCLCYVLAAVCASAAFYSGCPLCGASLFPMWPALSVSFITEHYFDTTFALSCHHVDTNWLSLLLACVAGG